MLPFWSKLSRGFQLHPAQKPIFLQTYYDSVLKELVRPYIFFFLLKAPTASLTISPSTLPLIHFVPTTLVSLQFFKHSKHSPSSVPLDLLFLCLDALVLDNHMTHSLTLSVLWWKDTLSERFLTTSSNMYYILTACTSLTFPVTLFCFIYLFLLKHLSMIGTLYLYLFIVWIAPSESKLDESRDFLCFASCYISSSWNSILHIAGAQ